MSLEFRVCSLKFRVDDIQNIVVKYSEIDKGFYNGKITTNFKPKTINSKLATIHSQVHRPNATFAIHILCYQYSLADA